MFKNKTAVVTGAAKGIGYGIALTLAKGGANVVLGDLDDSVNENSAREIEKQTKSKCLAVKCDVSKKEDVDSLVAKAVEKFGGVDILVNNAGIFPFKPFMELSENDWDKVLDVNLKSVFLCSQAAAKVMKDGGKIISISSIASFVGFEGLTHYCASKGGINGLTRALALELAPRKINVNAVAPGSISTPGSDGVSDDQVKKMNEIIPWKRMGTPEDIAGAVAYLASSGADYVTGQIITVDGGWTLR
ncbi:MAG: SDR family NAD(P)-dependent oxidoreductase [Candidatus Paceibacterota bacterium]|jgi:NAD(P)-dependent dehydrogenase (short-subunit alcohol dehydrogenase family)